MGFSEEMAGILSLSLCPCNSSAVIEMLESTGVVMRRSKAKSGSMCDFLA